VLRLRGGMYHVSTDAAASADDLSTRTRHSIRAEWPNLPGGFEWSIQISPGTTIGELRASIAESAVAGGVLQGESVPLKLPVNFRIAVRIDEGMAIFTLGDGQDEQTLESVGFNFKQFDAFAILPAAADDDDE